MRNRADKIRILQGLQTGKISIEDLAPKKLLVMAGYGPGPEDDRGSLYFINEVEVTESQFKEIESRQPLHNTELGYGPEED